MIKLLKISIFAFILSLSASTYAADISVYTNNGVLYTGDEFVVDILVNSQTEINAVEGSLKYSPDSFELEDIRDGNSVINFWIEKKETSIGEVSFSGITAAGFKGTNQKILSVVMKAKKEGSAQIFLENVKLLENDGKGTDVLESIFNTTLDIKNGLDNKEKPFVEDFESPEYFAPEIISNENVFDGKNVLVFSTQDKGVGMSHYEIKEGFFDYYKEADSPFLLKNQKLNKNISIKAVDLNGNERVVTLSATHPDSWYTVFIKILIALLLITFIIFMYRKFLWRRN